MRLQYSAFTEIASLARTNPLRAKGILLDAETFPPKDRDFVWGYHFSLCHWVRKIVQTEGVAGRVALIADGKTAFAVQENASLKLWRLRLWDMDTGQVRTAPIALRVEDLSRWSISPDGKLVATLCRNDEIQVWDTRTGDRQGQPIAVQGPIWTMRFSADGGTIATIGETGLTRWVVKTGLPLTPSIRRVVAEFLVLSPDGRTIATWSERRGASSCGTPRQVSHVDKRSVYLGMKFLP